MVFAHEDSVDQVISGVQGIKVMLMGMVYFGVMGVWLKDYLIFCNQLGLVFNTGNPWILF